MPKYVYQNDDNNNNTLIIEINHPIGFQIKNVNDVKNFINNNKGCFFSSNIDLDSLDNEILLKKILFAPNTHFKGSGWVTSESIALKYKGKNKKLYEKLKEDRYKRKTSKKTITDINKNLGLNKKAQSSVVTNKEWQSLTKEQKKIATENGIRPSKDYTTE